jgi:hypothetical protein
MPEHAPGDVQTAVCAISTDNRCPCLDECTPGTSSDDDGYDGDADRDGGQDQGDIGGRHGRYPVRVQAAG